MIHVSLRFIFRLLCLVLFITAVTYFIAHELNSKQRIYAFFVESDNCEAASCFAGIIPGESTPGMTRQMLSQSQYVDTVNVEQIDFLTREIRFSWNGTQPGFLRDDAVITLFSAEVEAIELPTDLSLGDIIVTMGEPDTTVPSVSTLFMAYSDEGFFVESSINCDAIWYSPVIISYRWDNFELSGDISVNDAIQELCN